MPIIGFFEDYDGEMVLSDVRNYENGQDFVHKAEKYVKETRGYRVPVLEPSIMEIILNDEAWRPVDDTDLEVECETITVYVSYLHWDAKE